MGMLTVTSKMSATVRTFYDLKWTNQFDHDLHLSVNGVKEKISRYSLSPSLGVLIAGECVVRGVGGERPELHDTQTLFVQPANPSRVMSGREAIVCTVHTIWLSVQHACGVQSRIETLLV